MLKKLLNMTLAVLVVFGSLGPAPFLASVAHAEVSDTISYQGRLRDSAGVVVANEDYDFTFTLYGSSGGDDDVWTESKSVSVTDGYFSVQLGSVTPLDGAALSGERWLAVTVEGEEFDSRVAINSVAYAMTSRAIESLDAPPAEAYGGRMYYDTGDGQLYVYNADTDVWVSTTDTGPDTDTSIATDDLEMDGNHSLQMVGNTLTFDGAGGDVVIDDTGLITADALAIAGGLDVGGFSTFVDQVDAQGALVNTLGSLSIQDDAEITGDLVVSGDSTLASIGLVTPGSGAFTTLSASGDLTTNGVFTATGEIFIGDDADPITVTGTMSLDGSFSQTGLTTFSTGTGEVSLNGNTTVDGTLDVTGGSTLDALEVNGAANFLDALSVNLGADFGLGYDGPDGEGATIDSNGTISANGSLVVDGDISAGGTTSLASLDVNAGQFTVVPGEVLVSSGNVQFETGVDLQFGDTSEFTIGFFGGETNLASTTGSLNVNASGGAINIGNAADDQAINVGPVGIRAIAIGNVDVGSTLVLSGGDAWNVDADGNANFASIGATFGGSGAFTALSASGDFAIAGTRFTVDSDTGDTAASGTLTIEGLVTANAGIGNDALTWQVQENGDAAFETVALGGGYGVGGTTLSSLGDISMGDDLIVNGTATFDNEIFLGDDPLEGIYVTGTLAPGDNDTLTMSTAGGVPATLILNEVDDSIAIDSADWSVDSAGAANFGSIGLTTAGSGAFTTLSNSGLVTANGGITADSGAFTVADVSGDVHTGGTMDVDGAANVGGNLTFDKQLAHTIQISDSTDAATAGGALTVKAAAGTTTAPGGDLSLVGGAGGPSADANADGGDVFLTGGAVTGNNGEEAGSVTIDAGAKALSSMAGIVTIGGSNAGLVSVGSNFSLLSLSGGTVNLSTTATSTITVGSTGSTGTLTLGRSTASNTINVGNAAPGAGNTQTINIGATASATSGLQAIAIGAYGSSTGVATVTIKAGGNGVTHGPSVTLGNTSTTAVCSSLAGATPAAAGVAYELIDCSGAPAADYAERYPTDGASTYGDIVVPGFEVVYQEDESNGRRAIAQAVKSSVTYQGPVIGIVSNNYGDFTSAGNNISDSDNPMPVALVGRVPVNVTNENGPIAVGDFVTTSSTAGKGMRATEAGRVIGMALSSFDGTDGQVMVQVINTWYQPDASDASSIQGGSSDSLSVASGDLVVSGDATFEGSVTVAEHLVGSSDMAGRAHIVSGDTRVHVDFDEEYAYQPIVNATLRSNVNIEGYWWIEEESTTGFDIVLDGTLASDVEFNWIAVGVDGGEVSVSDGSTREIELYVLDGSSSSFAPAGASEDKPVVDSSSSVPSGDEVIVAEESAMEEVVVMEETPVVADEPVVEETVVAEELPVVEEQPTAVETAPVVDETIVEPAV